MTSKERRNAIYLAIEINIGKMPKGFKSYLSKMLKEYVKEHNSNLVKTNNLLFEALNEKGRILDAIRGKKIRNQHKENTHKKLNFKRYEQSSCQ